LVETKCEKKHPKKRRFLKTDFFDKESSEAYIDIRHYIPFNVEEKLGVPSTISLRDRKM
jgi:hypothetical protein